MIGFVVLWLVLDRTATWLDSVRGEAGIQVCAATIGAALLVEHLLAPGKALENLRSLGLRRSGLTALGGSLALSAALLSFYPAFAIIADKPLRLHQDWLILLPGLFAQGGVAEEVVFRGFLFRRLRLSRSFWGSAVLSALPFTAIHLLLFISLDPIIAAVSIVLSLSISFPLAWLFERSGGSVWPVAVVHFTIQGSIKLIETDTTAMAELSVGWIAVCATVPWAAFALRAGPQTRSSKIPRD